MSARTGTWQPRVPPTAVLRNDTVRGGDVLLLPERVVVLRGSARAVLEMCDGTLTVEEIITRLGRDHDQPDDTVRDDVIAFLTRLRAAGGLQ
ncbi:pyrroloquinoline quinone biosynthesis peptide chaperone PqqD [Streptomyces sp. NPDC101455]|uniref:pyrroloquinoline quinone biosynthesis peptide chaperone PqqD n=1 Tax=Streptomyces sp. NPDC101455 TaxID=3366142 RepID=UPI003825C113